MVHRVLSGIGLAFASLSITLAGAPLAAAGVIALGAGLVLLSYPVLGAATLVGMAQTDGLFGRIDAFLPMSSFKLLSAGLLAVLIVTANRNPALLGRPRPSLPILATMLFAVWLAFSHLMAVDMDAGQDHLKGFLLTLLVVPFVALTVTRRRHLFLMAAIVVASGAISAAAVLLESKMGIRLAAAVDPSEMAAWQGELRSAGASAYNPTTAAHLVLVSAIMAIVMALRDARWRWFWALGAACCLAGLGLMGARSAILGLAVGLVAIGWTQRRHRLFPMFCMGAVAAVLAVLPFVPASLWERFAAVLDLFGDSGTGDRTLLRRLSYNLIGLDLWMQHPILGVGPGGFPELYAGPEYRWYPGRLPDPRQLHNSYMEVLAETGIVGLLLFVTACFGAARLALRAGSGAGETAALAQACGMALLAFLVASLFMPNEDNKYMWILVALCCRAAWIHRTEEAGP